MTDNGAFSSLGAFSSRGLMDSVGNYCFAKYFTNHNKANSTDPFDFDPNLQVAANILDRTFNLFLLQIN